MVPYKKKTIILFAILVLIGTSGICTAAAGEVGAERSFGNNSYSSLSNSDPNFTVGSGRTTGTGTLIRRMILMLLLVVVFGVGAIYVSRKFLPRLTNLPGRKIVIVESIGLGPRRSVHLLKVGSRMLLVGSTNENINQLADVTEALKETDLGTIES